MWFKQCKAYRLPETPDAAVLAEALDEHRFVQPGGMDWFTDGFTVPQPFGDELVFAANKTLGISLKREEAHQLPRPLAGGCREPRRRCRRQCLCVANHHGSCTDRHTGRAGRIIGRLAELLGGWQE